MVISDVLDIIRLLFVSEKKPFLRLKAILGFYPHNLRLYRLALLHKSKARYDCGNENKEGKTRKKRKFKFGKENSRSLPPHVNNERLEFLGDAVLSAIVADILYKHYSNKQEGFLTNLRSKIVCRSSLNKLAVDLGLDKLIQHTGAVTTAHNSFMNGNAFEAFFGAIYLDRGYRYCYRFLEDTVFKHYINIDHVAKQEKNFKSLLIEWCQKYQYHILFQQEETRDAQDHNAPKFHSSVLIEGIVCGAGDGYSKKESDQNAAQQALRRIKKDNTLEETIQNAIIQKKNPPTSTEE